MRTNIFKSLALDLIPDNLKNQKLFQDALGIMIEYIEENAPEALNVMNIYEETSTSYEYILKMYAQSFVDVLEKAKENVKVQEQLIAIYEKYNSTYDASVLDIDIKTLISKDNFELLKNFYQTKGKIDAFQYVYNLFDSLNLEGNLIRGDSYFDISSTSDPLTYKIQTSMLGIIYEQYVKPLVHPLGWAYIYERMLTLNFTDEMFVTKSYNVSNFRIENTRDFSISDDFKNNIGYLFQTDANGNAIIGSDGYPNYYKVDKNPVSGITRFGTGYTESAPLSLESEICLVKDNTIAKIEKYDGAETRSSYIIITFASGEILEYYAQNPDANNQRTLILYYGTGPNNLNKTIKKDYSPYIGEYGLDLVYKTEYFPDTGDKWTYDYVHGLYETLGDLLFCGSDGTVSNHNKCGSIRIGNKTDNNQLVRVRNLQINPSIKNTRQTFIGYKYKYPTLFIRLNLTAYSKDEFPLIVKYNEFDNFTIRYDDVKGQKYSIIRVPNVSLNENYTLAKGYSDTEHTTSIYSNGVLLESCTFRLVPSIDTTERKKIPHNDFTFELNRETMTYSRDATHEFFYDDPNPPSNVDISGGLYIIDWDRVEYEYFANIEEMPQQLPYSKIKEIDLYNYLIPKYYSNIVGHFKAYDMVYGFLDSKQRITLDYPQNRFCSDFGFEIELIKSP